MSELVHNLSGNSWQLQHKKLNNHCGVGKFGQILEVDYAKACKFLSCIPRVELPLIQSSTNSLQLPFLDERILFSWENGVLVDSRPLAANVMTTTKERILRLVLAHDFTTMDERLALIVALNADVAQNVKDLSGALRSSRKKH